MIKNRLQTICFNHRRRCFKVSGSRKKQDDTKKGSDRLSVRVGSSHLKPFHVFNTNVMHVKLQKRPLMSGKLCCNLTLIIRRRRKLTQKLLTVLLIVLLAVLVCLHFAILPSVSGGYNEECYLSDEKRRTLRIMVQNISRVFDKFGVQYWLDFGTLLGAYRTADILPHDHDADISYILSTESSEAFRELRGLGMKANGLVATFRNATVDFMRWKQVNESAYGKTEVMLHKFYPTWTKDNFILKYHHTLETFPQSWVVPPERINFHGVDVSIPNSPERLLAFRYPYTFGTFGFQFPYKWKCWVPCMLRASNGC